MGIIYCQECEGSGWIDDEMVTRRVALIVGVQAQWRMTVAQYKLNPYKESRRELGIKRIKQGLSNNDIMKRLGVSRDTVRDWRIIAEEREAECQNG